MIPFEKFRKAYQGKKVLIMGLGLLGGGVGAARLFVEIGAKVTVTDLKSEGELKPSLRKLKNLPIKFVLGEHRRVDFEKADLVIKNPAVPKNSRYLSIAREHNIPVSMDAALFAKFCPVFIIGITGTRGKTTTATLIYKLLKTAGRNTLLGGNVKGVTTLSLLKKIKPNSIVVLELSSWQLQGFDQEKISPDIAVITNIYSDHLNRYKNMDDYINDKKIIFKYQKKDDILVLNRKNPYLAKMAGKALSKVIWFDKNDFPSNWKLKLIGEHNRENAAAAYIVGMVLGLSLSRMKLVFRTFTGVKFRLEEIAKVDGIKYVNDTASTMPIATIAALNAIESPIILLAGGASKNLDLSDFGRKITERVKGVVLLNGTATEKLINSINRSGGKEKILGCFDNLREAVLCAKEAADSGDVVLLSPGCASFGMFRNEYDRGEQFNKIVKSLC